MEFDVEEVISLGMFFYREAMKISWLKAEIRYLAMWDSGATLHVPPSMRLMKMAHSDFPCSWDCSGPTGLCAVHLYQIHTGFIVYFSYLSKMFFLVVWRCLWLLLVIWSWTVSLAVQRHTNGPGSGDTAWHPGLLWLLIKGHPYLAFSLMRYCRNTSNGTCESVSCKKIHWVWIIWCQLW